MARRRRKRYQNRKHKKQEDLFESIVGIVVLGSGALYLRSADIPMSSEEIYAVLLKMLILLTFVLAVVWIMVFIVKRNRRNYFYKQQEKISDLQAMHPKDFEEYLSEMYRRLGYSSKTTSYGKDHGIDVIIQKDGKKYAIQAKRYNNKNYVGEPEVRNFFGSYADSDYTSGFFITTSFFSRAAIEWSKNRNITLIDGGALQKMMSK